MKIKVFGEYFPVVNVQFHNYGVAITYFDAESRAPHLMQIHCALDEFRERIAFIGAT